MKKTYKAPSIRVFGDLVTLTEGSIGSCGDGTSLSDVVIGAIGSVTLTVGTNTGVITGCLRS